MWPLSHSTAVMDESWITLWQLIVIIYLPNDPLVKRKVLMGEINRMFLINVDQLSSLPPFRLWRYGDVWDSAHQVRIWRKTWENLPTVLQVFWSSTRCTILNISFCFYPRFCGFIQPAVLQTLRRTSWKQSIPSSGRSSAGSSWRQSLYHTTSSMSRLEANDFLLWKGHGQAWTEQVRKLTCPESSYTINTTFQR